ncbi:galactoside 2-alpha-L-fucosyltransferase-like [Triticum aestivum]|uniref:Fucosyltransferase n=1 Tax=Aegilops tauschii TaxID=37682 RepID=M8BXL1_AEGTA|nr:galactoside 2-alpha-L-fucosyltransferase-like [Triticum aestivum]
MRRAWPAVCVVAATLLAVVVLSAARDGYGLPMVPSSWLSVEDVPPSNLTTDQLLDGLLTAEFGSRSCRSRENCRYLVPISYRGLGNRMLSTVSAFLYAVLTERTLLVQHDMAALFCEPFPGTTWLLPSSGWLGGGFPLGHLKKYGKDSKESLGNMLKANVVSVGDNGNASWSDSDRPPYVYLHLDGGYGFYDKLFYCDEQQRLIRGAPWLLMRTDSYLVPGLFLVPSSGTSWSGCSRRRTSRSTTSVEIVKFASHEGWQKMWDASQDRKALSEMYLLSTCDVLVTTGFSTFGYVAQGLGEILPWIMPATPFWSTETGVVPDPPCMRAMSVEPCFHSPSNYDCAARKDVDVGTLVPYIRHCEDASWGLKHHHTEVGPAPKQSVSLTVN